MAGLIIYAIESQHHKLKKILASRKYHIGSTGPAAASSCFIRGRYSPNRCICFLDLGLQSVQPFPISLLLYLLYIQRLVSSNQYVKLKMQNSFNLSLFKLRMSKKCITFEPKLWFTKFKSLNWSEFHQDVEFLPNF